MTPPLALGIADCGSVSTGSQLRQQRPRRIMIGSPKFIMPERRTSCAATAA